MLKYFSVFLFLTNSVGYSQLEHPRISPTATLIQKIGLSEIRIDYSRPSARGRKVMGELVPFNRIWRVGANESTKILFSDSAKINGTWIPAGTYALYAFPNANYWTLIIHKNTTHWGDGRHSYNPSEDQIRFNVAVLQNQQYVESFMISFDDLTHESAKLKLEWEFSQVAFTIEFNTHARMMIKIQETIAVNPTATTYYESARYLQEQNLKLETAREYISKAYALAGDKYYIHRVWALIEGQLNNFSDAIHHAQLSKTLAAIEGKDEFVNMNERSIQEWKKK